MYGPYQVYLGGGVNPPHAPAIPLEWYCPEHRHISVVAEVDEEVLRNIIAYTPFEYVNNRATFTISYLKGHTLTDVEGYYEAAVGIAVKYQDFLSSHIIYMYCDNATAILAGREGFGMPKKDADVHLWEEGGHKWGKVVREAVTLFEVDFVEDQNTPDVRLVDEEELVGALHVRRLPKVDSPGDAYRDITFRDTKSQLLEKIVGRATLSLGELKWDPIYQLAPRVIGATFIVNSFGGYFHEETRKILYRWTNED